MRDPTLSDLPKRPPIRKTQDRFAIPQGLYKLRTGQLNNQLQRLYTRYMNSGLTKDQTRRTGSQRIREMSTVLKRDVGRWLRKFKQGVIDPDIWDEVDGWTTQKIREWETIVEDM